MNRTLIAETPKLIGQEVRIKGWVNSVRAHGQLVFADIRDRSGIIQVVGDKTLTSLHEEYVVDITGTIRSRDSKYVNTKIATGTVELEVKSLEVLEKSEALPFDIHQPDINISLPILLDNRSLSLRNKKIQDVFKVQATIVKAFRDFLNSEDFTEIFVPTIVAGSTEGGSEVFPVDYFGYKAYLAQSPQLYKQVLIPAFERVFTVAHAYRAEPSVTTRHLTEYVGLDVEFGFIDSWLDVVKNAESAVKAIFKAVSEKHQDILDEYGVTVPKTIENTPVIKLKDALKLIYERTGRDVRNELDMDPEGEREICRWAEEKFGSDLVFITHFYTKKRAWYSFPDPENPEETLTLDLIGRGVEWISGGQRISNYSELQEKIKSKDQDPADFEIPYGQTFRYGMPPEGGYCLGLERITMNILGLDNLRKSSLFPRDMERIDNRLSVIGKKYSLSSQVSLHDKLINFLKEKSVDFKELSHQETKTSLESAAARGTTLEQGAKALLMFADNSPILVVLSAAQKLDNGAFKKYSLSSQVSLHDKLINFLKEKSVDFKELSHQETKTSVESAAARGTSLEQGAKALLMFADNNPILVVLSAAQKLDNGAFKKEFNFKGLRMATPEEVKKQSGVEIGAVPPFGNLFNTPVFVDQGFLKETDIAFNAGSPTSSIILKSADFVKLVSPKIGSYAQS